MIKISLREQINEYSTYGFFEKDSQIEPIYRCIDQNVDRVAIQQANREIFNPVYQCKRNYTAHINERVNSAILYE